MKKMLFLTIASLMLAGCTDLDTGFDATIKVDSASSVAEGEGFCGYDETEQCHTLSVSLTNNGESEVSTNMFYWDAVGSNGGVFSTPDVDGPEACAGGATCTVTLHFDVTNGSKLVTLKWDDIFDNMETSIPAY